MTILSQALLCREGATTILIGGVGPKRARSREHPNSIAKDDDIVWTLWKHKEVYWNRVYRNTIDPFKNNGNHGRNT